MIYTVTLNPAVDYLVRLDELKEGSLNRTHDEVAMFGGKGINVSCVLSELGMDSVALGFVGGFTGDFIEKSLKEKGVMTDFVRLIMGITRINIKIKGCKETELNGRGPEISEDKLEEFFEKLNILKENDTLVLAGSTPNSLPCDVYEKILCLLSGKGIKFIVDASGDALKSALKFKPFLIKPNRKELEEIMGEKAESEEKIFEQAKKLQEMGAKNVLISLAGDGALLLDEKGETHKVSACRGKVINSVGAGDSMVAGFLAGFYTTGDYSYALRLGTAAGGATAFSESLAQKDKIFELLKTI